MEEPRKLVVLCIIILTISVDDLFGDAASVRKIALNEPRYILGRKFSQVHVLTNSGPASADYWTFYVPPKFVLNLAFINYTAETSSTGTYCKEHYASVTVFNAEHGTSHTLPPYCGQKRNGIKVNGTVGIHLIKNGFSGSISMAVVTEPSTKNCGGFFSNSSVGMPLNFNLYEFPSKDTLIHCTWYFEFQTSQTLRFLISRMVLRHDATPLCSYYKEFIAIRSLDERTGEEKNIFLQCKQNYVTLPIVLSQIASRKFVITVHTERTIVWRVGIVNGVCFFETKGKEGAFIEVYAPGKRPLGVTSQANTTGFIIDTLFFLKPKYKGTQIFFVLSNLEPVCIRGKIDAWTVVNSYLGRVPDLCKTVENNGLMSGKFDTIFAIHVHGELRHLERAIINYFPTNAGCGGVFSLAHGQRQIISSPMTASRSYPANSYCQWSFVASSNTVLSITFTSMDLEPCFTSFSDYVELFSGFRTPLQLNYKICHIPAIDMKLLGDMTIRFYSDDIVQMDGFVMIVAAYNGGESTTRIPDGTSIFTNEVPRLSTSVSTVIKTEFTKFSSKKTTKTKKPCCKSTSSLTNSTARRKHHRQSTTAVVEKKTVNGRVALSSNNLYTISIAFGAGAVVIVVIIIVLLKRRKRTNPSYSKSNNTSSNNFDTDTVNRIIHRDKKSFCEQYPLENIYSNPSDENAKVEEKPPDVIYANTMSSLTDRNRCPESGAIVYETMNAQPIKESEHIPDQYICPDSQKNKSGDNKTFIVSVTGNPTCEGGEYQSTITYEAMNGLEVPRSSSNNMNNGVYVDPSKL